MNNKSLLKRLALFALLLTACVSSAMAQSLYMNSQVIRPGETQSVTINLYQGNNVIYGLQTDLVLSEGLSLVGDPVAVSEVMSDPTPNLNFTKLSSGAVRIIMFSMNGKTFNADAKEVITLNVKASDGFTGGSLKLTNSRLTTNAAGQELSVSSAVAVVSDGTSSQVNEDVWTVPDPSNYLEFTDVMPTEQGQAYLYNPAAKMFFYSGYDWNTRATLATKGFETWFVPSTESDAPEGSYEFWDNFTNPERGDVYGPHNCFTDDGGSTWVDHGSQGNYSWAITMVDGFVRIQNVALIADKPDYDGKYLGWNGTDDRRLYMLDPTVGGASVDWKFVTAESFESFFYSEDYEAYAECINKYFSGIALAASLKEAEALNINITDYLELYNDTGLSYEDLDGLKAELDALISAKKNLQKLVDEGAELNAPIEEGQALLANGDASERDMNAAINKLSPIIEARKNLKKVLDEAKDNGFDESAPFDAVYNDKTSTAGQLRTALDDLNAALVEWGRTHATVEKPADMTSLIVNPNFDNASSDGWYGTVPNMVGSGNHGPANVAEVWNNTFDTYQYIDDLPIGVYALGAKTMWRGSWNDMKNNIGPAAFLYAMAGDVESSAPFNYAYGPLNTVSMAGATPWGVGAGENSYTDEESGITYYIPNDPSAFRLYEEAGLYDTNVLFAVLEAGSTRIGVKNPAKKGDSDNWSLFDTFTLKYYGSGADACSLYLNDILSKHEGYVPEEGTIYTEAYLAAYQASYQVGQTINSLDEVSVILNGIEEAKANLDQNIDLWKDYQQTINNGYRIVTNENYQEFDETVELWEYLESETENILAAHALTNEELTIEIAKINNWIDAIKEQWKMKPFEGKDYTEYIVNPGFEDGISSAGNPAGLGGDYGVATGWNADKYTTGNFTPGPLGTNYDAIMTDVLGAPNHCFEAWHCHKFDLWQEIENLPVGMYELQVQGYVRCEVEGYNRGDDIEPNYPSPVYLYMNDAMSQFPSVYSDCPADWGYDFTEIEGWTTEEVNGNLYPNSMGGAAQCFAWGMYKTTAFGLIAKQGDKFRIGVKMDANQDWWTIFDNFKLIWHEPTAEIVEPLLRKELAKMDLTKPMSKTVYQQAVTLMENSEATIASGDGVAMFEMLSDVYAVTATIIESSAKFEPLVAANEKLYRAIERSDNAASILEAIDLYDLINNGILDHQYEETDIEGLLGEIAVMKTKLALPEDWENASDDYPANVTNAIQSPSFFDEDEAVNTAEGWNNPGSLGIDDVQLMAEAMEFWQIAFDMNQTIVGLPEGTYIVQADAWCRIGDHEENFEIWSEDNNATMSFLYAVDGNGSIYESPVANMMKAGDVLMEPTGYEGEEEFWASDGNTYYLPGSLVSSKGIIDNNGDVYTNTLVTQVKADGTLTLGIKKDEQKTYSWVVCDNFRLYYLGKNSNAALDVVYSNYKGDANYDGRVRIDDAVDIVNNVLGKETSAKFSEENADVNMNGSITMGDVVCTVDIILGNNAAGARQADGNGDLAVAASISVPVTFENMADYTAFQMDVTLPEGVGLSDVAFTTGLSKSHVMSFNCMENGKVRIVGWSAKNAAMKSVADELFTLRLLSNNSTVSATIDNIYFVAADGTCHEMPAMELYAETTGINTIATMKDSKPMYDLQGRRVVKPTKGLYIQNGKKLVK